jgi:hypothetical protein
MTSDPQRDPPRGVVVRAHHRLLNVELSRLFYVAKTPREPQTKLGGANPCAVGVMICRAGDFARHYVAERPMARRVVNPQGASMTRIAFLVASALAAMLLPIATAHAQNWRCFVSAANGSDSNTCSRALPDRSARTT